jgi:hypothetical protein
MQMVWFTATEGRDSPFFAICTFPDKKKRPQPFKCFFMCGLHRNPAAKDCGFF